MEEYRARVSFIYEKQTSSGVRSNLNINQPTVRLKFPSLPKDGGFSGRLVNHPTYWTDILNPQIVSSIPQMSYGPSLEYLDLEYSGL